MERTDARRITLPSPVDLVTIDAGWTRQREIVPAALRILHATGRIISLIKPHYEAPPDVLRDGVVPDDAVDGVLNAVRESMGDLLPRVKIIAETPSPIRGQGGNAEYLWLMMPVSIQ
jgi:predicted rRNA methylase YqxC with S4 and FtsJ domains